MFTVIFCSEALYENCTVQYGEFLAPFLKNSDFAFCKWNASAQTLDDAVPDLKSLIRNKNQWRALAVLDQENYSIANIRKLNPYNFVDSRNDLTELTTPAEIEEFRSEWNQKFHKALENPLVKLGMWIAGAPSSEYPGLPQEYDSLPDYTDETYFEELRIRNLKALEVEMDRITAYKGDWISDNFVMEGELQKKPSQFIALCERRFVNDNKKCKAAWNVGDEHDYSRFYEDNLYSDRLRCLLSDVQYVNGKRKENSYFKFLTLVLLLARETIPSSAIRQGRVYSIDVNIDRDKMSDCYYGYVDKLAKTLQNIGALKKRNLSLKYDPLTNKEVEEMFISDVEVPVEIPAEFNTDALKCKHDKIGFAKDCPIDQYHYWERQYRDIEKGFIRYLREPRRAVKTAVKDSFRKQNAINDERSASLTEYQTEEVQLRLLDEEESMIKTRTIQLFKTKEYTDLINEADKEIKRNIRKRMTRKNTIIAGAIAALAYILGFIPLFFGITQVEKSVMVNLIIFGVCVGLFLGCGFAFVALLRKRSIDRFKHFNFVMSGILSDIEFGLHNFSVFLSHCCNVMREFSVLNTTDKERVRKLNLLKKHEFYIKNQMVRAQNVFAGNIQLERTGVNNQTPYDYDFFADTEHSYGLESVAQEGLCEFLSTENFVKVPVDYIESVTLTREELYD